MNKQNKQSFTRYPVVTLSSEFLVMGHLMRRNILTYKAPPNNEGYDLLCIHPDPRTKGKQVRIQVKSRFATDCNRAFIVKEKTLDAFDFLIVAFLNIGYFFRMAKRHPCRDGAREAEFYTFPASFIRRHRDMTSSWGTMQTRGLDIEKYKNEQGFELVAKALGIPYPEKKGK